MNHDGVSVATTIVLASFAIERLSAGILFLLSSSTAWRRKFVDPLSSKDDLQRAEAERKNKWIHFLLVGCLVSLLLWRDREIGVLAALEIQGYNEYVDLALTWLILVAGSDQVAQLLKGGDRSAGTSAPPIEITGRVTLVEDDKQKSTGAHG